MQPPLQVPVSSKHKWQAKLFGVAMQHPALRYINTFMTDRLICCFLFTDAATAAVAIGLHET